ncbi:MAG: dihydroorotate dehydrogenase [Acidaminococcales bacterium]|jgi:dihydroorotate dehydrogenase (NAD+) catalytic subunit|nr:dihydroorotate dehydrogenase [Acidaminococcales bacterium]MDR3348086.1 dihydroorotate dehydrogenase [Acidaminococcales bacterium]
MSAADGNKLAVEIAGIKMKTPVMTASGTCGYGLELLDFVDLNSLGALVVKGATLEPCPGNAGQRIAETPAGALNAIGLENPGVGVFIDNILPALRRYDVPVIANIAGRTVDEYAELARRLDATAVAGIEINISCPNIKAGGLAFGTRPGSAAEVVGAVRRASGKPIITKLSPNVTDIAEIARAAEAAGSDALSLINTLVGMKIDIKRKQPALGNIFGGLSGPAVRPVAVRMVWQAARAVKIPVIGMGGIAAAEDALEFIMAGASAVAVGSATFADPQSIELITQGLRAYMREEAAANIGELVGAAWPPA